ncbi:MAG: two-component sensor histidine kinase [Acetobacteraceae bacterium]|nr:two-component sensor histidine kinase [Acetobacteraceae bacterium]
MPHFMIALVVAAAPVTALLAMALTGLAAPWPATVAIAVTLVPAAAFSLLWARDLNLLTAAVRQMEAGGDGGGGTESVGPTLMEPLGREIARLARHLAARAARIEQERLADTLILERLPDPVVVLRRDRTVSRRNLAAEAIFGADLAAVLRHPALRDALDHAIAQGETKAADLAIAAPVARELRATVVPIDPPLRDGGCALAVLSDRTREHSIERSHADFVANVSHELRTPLASLIGFTETLLGPAEDDPPARKRFLAIMAEQAARMNRLIDDLLSLSRIEMAEHQTPSDRVDLVALLPRIVAGYEPRLAGGSYIETMIPPDLPVVTGDADQIAQVIQNLLDNAVKYGREGGTVRLNATLPRPGDSWPSRPGVIVAVADEGAGIPQTHIPRITERFYRVDKGRSRAAGGTGLGLAIVKHIVNRHRGQLLIVSEEGLGTTVSVWLPLTQPGVRAGDAD